MADYLQQGQFSKSYQNGEFSLPRESNPDKKTKHNKAHYLAAARYAWARYCAGGMGIGFGGVIQNRSVKELRDYGVCNLNLAKYKDQLDPKWQNDKEKLLNISWQPIDVYTKLRNIAIARIQSFVFKPSVKAVNESAFEEKEIIKNKEKLKLNPELKQINEALGQQAPTDFESEQDIDIYEQLGGFSLDVEIGVKDAIDDTLVTDGDDLIRDMQIRDIVDLNCCTRHIEYCPVEKRIKEEYLDPAQTFWSPSAYPDCRDKWLSGTWKLMTIADLRAYLKKTGEYAEDTEATLEKAANSFTGYMNNAYPSSYLSGRYGTRESYYSHFGYYHYNHFKIPILTTYWKDTDTTTFVKGFRVEGNQVFKKIKEANIPKMDKGSEQAQNYVSKEIESVTVPTVYKCKWIIGTEFVFNCGTDSAIVRVGKDGAKIAQDPIVVWCNFEPSITARAIATIDDLQLVTYKMRHSWSRIPSATIDDYDIKLLETEIQLGSETLSIKDLIGIYESTGVRIMASKSEHGDPELGSNRPAIQTQVHPALAAMLQLKQIWLSYVDDLRSITGVNEMSDGTQTSGEMLVGVGQILEQSTNNALKPYIDAMRHHTEGVYKMIGYKYQAAVAYGDIERSYFRNAILQKYKLDKRILSYEFNISITSALNSEQKQAAIAFLQEQKNQNMLSPVDVIKATQFIINDDYAKANLYLATAIDKAQKRQHEMAIQQSQAQSQSASQAAVVASDSKIREIMAKKDADKELAALNHQFKLKEIEAEKSAHVLSEISLQHNLPQTSTQTI